MTPLYPLRLPPSFRERIWGSHDLAPVFGRQRRKIGEAWYSFDENVIANGPLKGQTLGDVIASSGSRLLGESAASLRSFPILAKLLFTSDRLSVQVHPKDDYALRNEGSLGKTEMWYILAAEPGAGVALGLTETLSSEQLHEAARSGEIEKYLNWVEVQAGQTVFVPAGTLHSIGPGLVLCEIQQNSDLTYRFYDFGRIGADGKPRELHIDKAVEVTEQQPHPGPIKPFLFPNADWTRKLLVACPYFAVEHWAWDRSIPYPGRLGDADLLIFLRGQGKIGDQHYAPGDAYLLPAGLEKPDLIPESPTEAIRAFVPNLGQLRTELVAADASPNTVHRLLAD